MQTEDLISHLEEHTYVKVGEIYAYVKERYQVDFTIPGMNSWLHCYNFSYKQPKATPAKADLEKQSAFIKKYETLLKATPEDESIEFGDGVHPTMATKITWIRTDIDKPIATTASITRLISWDRLV